MRLCSSLPANRSVCARRARGEEVCRSRWTEHPPGGDFHLATSGDFEMAIDNGRHRDLDPFLGRPRLVAGALPAAGRSPWGAFTRDAMRRPLLCFFESHEGPVL